MSNLFQDRSNSNLTLETNSPGYIFSGATRVLCMAGVPRRSGNISTSSRAMRLKPHSFRESPCRYQIKSRLAAKSKTAARSDTITPLTPRTLANSVLFMYPACESNGFDSVVFMAFLESGKTRDSSVCLLPDSFSQESWHQWPPANAR